VPWLGKGGIPPTTTTRGITSGRAPTRRSCDETASFTGGEKRAGGRNDDDGGGVFLLSPFCLCQRRRSMAKLSSSSGGNSLRLREKEEEEERLSASSEYSSPLPSASAAGPKKPASPRQHKRGASAGEAKGIIFRSENSFPLSLSHAAAAVAAADDDVGRAVDGDALYSVFGSLPALLVVEGSFF